MERSGDLGSLHHFDGGAASLGWRGHYPKFTMRSERLPRIQLGLPPTQTGEQPLWSLAESLHVLHAVAAGHNDGDADVERNAIHAHARGQDVPEVATVMASPSTARSRPTITELGMDPIADVGVEFSD